jgi:basic membrane protein A
MKKKLMTVVFVLAVFMLSSFAISSFAAPAAAKSTATNDVKHVAIVFSTGGLGDKSFNDAAYVGAQKANDTAKVKIDYVEPKDVTEINNYIESYASQTSPYSYDLIIAIGFSSADGVNQSSLKHPTQNFAIIDDNSINRSNVADITFKEQEGSFLVGAMAAMTTKSNIIGFLGGLDIPLINKFRAGYEQGAKYVNSSITVLAQYAPDPSNPWGDTAGGKQVANSFINQGADVIYAAAGGTGLGVFDAANESTTSGKPVYAIGVDSDQDYIQPGIVLTSMVKRVDTAVYNLITTTIDGTLSTNYLGKAVALGLKENGVAISNMTYTQTIANDKFTNGKFTADNTRWQIVQDLRTAIINGTIVVSPLVATTSTSSTPGFEASFIFLGLIAIPIIRKKLRK